MRLVTSALQEAHHAAIVVFLVAYSSSYVMHTKLHN